MHQICTQDTSSDILHCGAACTACPSPSGNGAATCTAGVCGMSCAEGELSQCSFTKQTLFSAPGWPAPHPVCNLKTQPVHTCRLWRVPGCRWPSGLHGAPRVCGCGAARRLSNLMRVLSLLLSKGRSQLPFRAIHCAVAVQSPSLRPQVRAVQPTSQLCGNMRWFRVWI